MRQPSRHRLLPTRAQWSICLESNRRGRHASRAAGRGRLEEAGGVESELRWDVMGPWLPDSAENRAKCRGQPRDSSRTSDRDLATESVGRFAEVEAIRHEQPAVTVPGVQLRGTSTIGLKFWPMSVPLVAPDFSGAYDSIVADSCNVGLRSANP